MRAILEETRSGPASKSQTPQLITNYDGSYNDRPVTLLRGEGV